MKIDEQHLLFYRSRKFWMIVFGIFFVVSVALFMLTIITDIQSNYTSTFIQKIDDALLSFGATLFMLYGYKIGTAYGLIGTIVYFILILILGYKTLQKPKVLLRYPAILSILYITGMITSILFLGSFS